MSLDQINDYSIGDRNIASMMETLDRQRRGYQAISLTHYDDDLEPKIAAGSIVELGGALFKCEADESITGWAGIGNDTDVYIKLVPSGTAATAAFTTAAPTWSTSKQGWYVGNDRYIAGLYKDGSGNYTQKHLFRGLWQKCTLENTGIKIGYTTRDSAGVQEITGIGFQPSVVIVLALDQAQLTDFWSIGFGNLITNLAISRNYDSKMLMRGTECIFVSIGVAQYMAGIITAVAADSFTITWTISGAQFTTIIVYLALP